MQCNAMLNKIRNRFFLVSSHVDSESGSDLESHEFLKEEFARIWNAYLADVLRALTDGAFELLFGQVSLAY